MAQQHPRTLRSRNPHSPRIQRWWPALLKPIAATLSAAALAATTACAMDNPTLPEWPNAKHNANEDLPYGASYADSADVPGDADAAADMNPAIDNTGSEEPYGSIKPDTRKPKERVPEIFRRGRLIVGVAQSLNRLGFRDPVTGDVAGFEVDLAREIARDIFGDPNRIEFRYVESRERAEALRSGDVDIVVRTMSPTRSRQSKVEFSIPYLQVHSRLLVLSDSKIESFDQLHDKTVCVTRDSTSAVRIKQYDVGRLLLAQAWTDCLMAMQRFQTDAIYTDDAILTGLKAQDPYTTLVAETSNTNHYAVAIAPPGFPRKTTGLVMQVNSTLERIRRDGTWQDLYDTWLADYLGPASPLPLKYRDEEASKELNKLRRKAVEEQ